MIRLAQLPMADVIDVDDVNELEIGDLIEITFPFFSAGRIAYGRSVMLLVVKKTPKGEVTIADPKGETLGPVAGPKANLLEMLSKETSYDKIRVLRPRFGSPGGDPEAQAKPGRGAGPSKDGRPVIGHPGPYPDRRAESSY